MKKKPILRINSNKGKKKQVFVSHTKKDEQFCNEFDRVCARVGMIAYRSEDETISKPAWKTIKKEMKKSIAMFFLVGKELVHSQDINDPEWRYTQNWIAFEMGLACQLGIDVWAICDDVLINFPIPYINNYLTASLKDRPAFNYLREILQEYKNGWTFSYPYENFGIICPHDDCRMEFNFHVELVSGGIIKCPQCLRDMEIIKS